MRKNCSTSNRYASIASPWETVSGILVFNGTLGIDAWNMLFISPPLYSANWHLYHRNLKKKYQHSLITAPSVHLHHSFFFAKWGTMPVSSWGRGLPSSFIFRLSSASWDRYFCNHIKNPKLCYQNWKYSTWNSLCLFRVLTLPTSQKERKHTEVPFCWKLKPENISNSTESTEFYLESSGVSEHKCDFRVSV